MISVRTDRPESAECIQPILCSGILINLKNGLEGIDRSEKSRPTLKWCEMNGQPVSFQKWSWLMTDWWLRRKTGLQVSTSNYTQRKEGQPRNEKVGGWAAPYILQVSGWWREAGVPSGEPAGAVSRHASGRPLQPQGKRFPLGKSRCAPNITFLLVQ